MKETVTLDGFMARYATAPDERKQAALTAAARVLDGDTDAAAEDQRTYALNELPPFFGLSHYTSLARLKVQRVGISYGGRLRYRLEDVRRWLQSGECKAIREERRRARKARDAKKGGRNA
jgi:hypothetical protein